MFCQNQVGEKPNACHVPDDIFNVVVLLSQRGQHCVVTGKQRIHYLDFNRRKRRHFLHPCRRQKTIGCRSYSLPSQSYAKQTDARDTLYSQTSTSQASKSIQTHLRSTATAEAYSARQLLRHAIQSIHRRRVVEGRQKFNEKGYQALRSFTVHGQFECTGVCHQL